MVMGGAESAVGKAGGAGADGAEAVKKGLLSLLTRRSLGWMGGIVFAQPWPPRLMPINCSSSRLLATLSNGGVTRQYSP